MILGISLLAIALVFYIQSLPSLRLKVSDLLSRSQSSDSTASAASTTSTSSFSKHNGEKKAIVNVVGDGAKVEPRSVVKQPPSISFILDSSNANENEDGQSDSDTPSSPAFSPPILSPPTLTLAAPATPDGSPIFAPTAVKDRIQVPYLSLGSVKLGSGHIINKPPTPPGDDDEDYVPSFPAINSAQRASRSTPSSASASVPTLSQQNGVSSLMLPPPLPNRFGGLPNSRRPTRNPAATMAANGLMDTLRSSRAGGLQTPPTITEKPKKPRKKVILEPGHSPLDWARLQRSGIDLRGISTPGFLRIKPSELKKHASAPDDVWTALNGKVYNLSAYLPFHPGGEKEALRGAGKDCTTLFMKVHPWVNAEGMLKECLIGFLVPEDDEDSNEVPVDGSKPVLINGSLEDVD